SRLTTQLGTTPTAHHVSPGSNPNMERFSDNNSNGVSSGAPGEPCCQGGDPPVESELVPETADAPPPGTPSAAEPPASGDDNSRVSAADGNGRDGPPTINEYILALHAQGLSNARIAREVGWSEAMIRNLLAELLAKKE